MSVSMSMFCVCVCGAHWATQPKQQPALKDSRAAFEDFCCIRLLTKEIPLDLFVYCAFMCNVHTEKFFTKRHERR